MKKKLLIIIGMLLGIASSASAGQEIVVLLSSRLPPYQEAAQGFRLFWAGLPPAGGLKSIQAAEFTEFVLAEEADTKALRRSIAGRRPDLLLAVGTNALAFAKNFRKIPVIYLLVPYPQALVAGNAEITGVNLDIPPDQQLAGFLRGLPGLKRLGLVYDPRHSGDLVEKARAACVAKGLTLIAREAGSVREVNIAVNDMAGRIDAFWMLPDLTVTTPQTVELLLLFSLENRVPLLTFSEKYLQLGAAMSVSFSPLQMGEQAGAMARRIMSGTAVAEVRPQNPDQVKIEVNAKIAKKLNIVFGPEKTAN